MSTSPMFHVDGGARKDQQRWMAIDWAMRAISVAIYACQLAHLDDIVRVLEEAHLLARSRRDVL